MNIINYVHSQLCIENIPVTKILSAVKTPCYLYSSAILKQQWLSFKTAFAGHPHLICYAVKANSNLSILKRLAQWGAGFDIVSQGELYRVLTAGGNPQKIIFSGVGKTADEIFYALQKNIFCFNVESKEEMQTLNQIASHLNVKAPIALRVNPDINPASHPYISTGLKENKFGIPKEEAILLYRHASTLKHLQIKGISCHIGSQITSLAPFEQACQIMIDLIALLKNENIHLKHLDLGGGLGIRYHQEAAPSIEAYAKAILALNPPLPLIFQPGRSLIGASGLLLTQVITLKKTKEKNFCIVDAGMNDLIRPALYQAWHHIIPVYKKDKEKTRCYDVVGPLCESADFLGKDTFLAIDPGDYLAICDVGAYGFAMSSNYNSRLRPCEVLVENNCFKIIRHRETLSSLLAQEVLW
jgi:diaminopimelate decarboxylase